MTQQKATWIEIKPSGEMNVFSHDDDITMELLQEKVGGYFENCKFSSATPFFLPAGDDLFDCFEIEELWCNEEGKIMKLAKNPIGTYCAFNTPFDDAPDIIVGVVVAKLRKLDHQTDQDTMLKTMTGLDMQAIRNEFYNSHMLPIFDFEEGVYQ